MEMLAELPDSGQPGEVQNLLTRPQTSDQLIDADTTSLDDGLNYMRISDNGQLVDLESGRPFLRRGDLIEMQ